MWLSKKFLLFFFSPICFLLSINTLNCMLEFISFLPYKIKLCQIEKKKKFTRIKHIEENFMEPGPPEMKMIPGKPGYPDHIETYIIVLLLIMVQNSLLYSAKVMHKSEPPQRQQQSQVKVTGQGSGFPAHSGGSFQSQHIHCDSHLKCAWSFHALHQYFQTIFINIMECLDRTSLLVI